MDAGGGMDTDCWRLVDHRTLESQLANAVDPHILQVANLRGLSPALAPLNPSRTTEGAESNHLAGAVR